ncbi:MAG TPA: aspartyl protease family protein [Gemmatimonadaceae bacterium]|jgi:hypothetical protein|nr:aspartyl protease family protein [Gemmatimonadaceae bacterium]
MTAIRVDYDEHRDWGVSTDPSFQQRPYIEVLVAGPARAIRLWCLIDSGADYSIFDEDVATDIGLTVGAGSAITVDGVAGSVDLDRHDDLELEMEGKLVQQCSCLFGSGQHGLVGRADFLSALDVGFDSTGWLYHT